MVNGTKIQYVSLVLSANEQEFLALRLSSSQPGDIIQLHEAPLAINVKLLDVSSTEIVQWSRLSLKPQHVVIPILPKRIHRHNEPKRMPIPGIGKNILPSRMQIMNEFPLEMSFAMTVEKSQGQTMNHVIIALSNRRGTKCQFDYSSIYVAFSRVRNKENIRILLSNQNGPMMNWSLAYIENLQPAKGTKAFFQGFPLTHMQWFNQKWNAKLAYDYYIA